MKITSIALAVGAILSHTPLVYADWGSDPADFITANPEVVDPELVVDSQGNILVGYAENIQDGQDVYLKKYSRDGSPLWNGEGVLLLDRNQTFTIEWGLAIDDEDAVYAGHWSQNHINAETGATERRSFITKTNADGTDGWDTPISPEPEATDDYEFFAHDNMFVDASEEGIAFAGGIQINTDPSYFRPILGDALYFGFMSKDGEVLWDKVLNEHKGAIAYAAIQIVDGGVVLVYRDNRSNGDNLSFYVQKYDFEGNSLWGEEPIQVQNAILGIPFNGNVTPAMEDDGNGGVAMSWVQGIGQSLQLIHFQHINANGETLFPSPIRLSAGNDIEFPNNSVPYVAVAHDSFHVVWSTRDGFGPFPGYHIMTQKVMRDGELAYGTEPVTLKTLRSEGNQSDVGSLTSGNVYLHDNQLSVSYSQSTDYTGNHTNIYRLDFDTESNFIRDVQTVEFNERLVQTTAASSLYGETALAFSTFQTSSITPLYIQSVNLNGEIGSNANPTLSYPQTPWFTKEDADAIIELSLSGTDSYELSFATDIEGVSFQTGDIVNGNTPITITPPAEFSGVVPFTATATGDDGETATMDYVLTVTNVEDAPVIELDTNEVSVGEDEDVTVEAQVSDEDTESLSIHWQQTSGEQVDFDSSQPNLSFRSPALQEDTQLTFLLTVSDGTTSVEEAVTVNIAADKSLSIAEQSVDLVEEQSMTIIPQLTAAKAPVEVSWTQISGPELTLSNPNSLELEITAPFVDEDATALLEVSLTDAFGQSATQTINVNVQNRVAKKSGGSLGSSSLLALLALVGLSRRFGKRKDME